MSLKKIKTIFAFIGIILLSASCDKLTQFDMEYDSSVVIQSNTGINLPFNVYSPDIETNSESTFEINDTRKDLIETVILKSLVLNITSPNNGDFSFLESVEIFINADGLSEEKIAGKTNIPESIGAELTLETTGIDIQEYIKADNFQLRLNTVTDEIITSDHHIDLHSVFFVDAKILGI
jgi:hypothetical protein